MNIVQQHVADGVVRLVLTGELDLATITLLTDAVERAITVSRPGRLVVDVAGLRFCDSTGVGALVEARDHAARCGVALHVANARGLTRRIMQVTGVLQALGA